MDTSHRKIELQAPADLTFLISQIRTAARQKLDLHLPPVSTTEEPDELRGNVEQFVNEFVAQVLKGLKGNVSINGIEVVSRGRAGEDNGEVMGSLNRIGMGNNAGEEKEGVETIYEPFDSKLRTQLSSTIARRDALISHISQHRRTTPAAAATAFSLHFSGESDALATAQADMTMQARTLDERAIAGVDQGTRAEEVRRNWQRALEGLGRLDKGLPETRARLERCGDVVGYLSGEGEK